MQITVIVDEASQSYLQDLRTLYYPQHLNNNEAHITLIYKIDDALTDIITTIETIAHNQPIFNISIIDVLQTPKGNQLILESNTLSIFRTKIVEAIDTHLFRKDKLTFVPHCTIQHGVTAYKAFICNQLIQKEIQYLNMSAVGIAFNTIVKGKIVNSRKLLFGG